MNFGGAHEELGEHGCQAKAAEAAKSSRNECEAPVSTLVEGKMGETGRESRKVWCELEEKRSEIEVVLQKEPGDLVPRSRQIGNRESGIGNRGRSRELTRAAGTDQIRESGFSREERRFVGLYGHSVRPRKSITRGTGGGKPSRRERVLIIPIGHGLSNPKKGKRKSKSGGEADKFDGPVVSDGRRTAGDKCPLPRTYYVLYCIVQYNAIHR